MTRFNKYVVLRVGRSAFYFLISIILSKNHPFCLFLGANFASTLEKALMFLILGSPCEIRVGQVAPIKQLFFRPYFYRFNYNPITVRRSAEAVT